MQAHPLQRKLVLGCTIAGPAGTKVHGCIRGGGSGAQKFLYQKWSQKIFPSILCSL